MKTGPDLPIGWTRTSLGMVFDVLDSQRVPVNEKERTARLSAAQKTYPYYGATGQVGEIDDHIFEGEAVLLGEDGAPFLDARRSKAYRVDGHYWVNNHAHILRARHGMSNRYFCHQLNAIDYRPFVSGTTRLKLTQAAMKEIPLVVAPIAEQHRIASRIDELFSEIEEGERALERVQKLVERYRQSVLKAAVTGELTREWREKHKGQIESGAALLQRILKARREAWELRELKKMSMKGVRPTNERWKQKYEEPASSDLADLPQLPNGWVWASAEQVCSSVRDGTHDTPRYVAQGVPLITSKNLLPTGLDFDSVQLISHEDHLEISKRSGVSTGDILFAMIGTVGNPVVVSTERAFSIKNVGLFKANERAYVPEFLRHWFLSPHFNTWLASRKKGTSQKFVPLGLLRSLPVPLPPLKEQQYLSQLVENHLESLRHVLGDLAGQRRVSASLRQAVLNAAFSGTLIAQDPSDGTASALLNRMTGERSRSDTAPKVSRKKRVPA